MSAPLQEARELGGLADRLSSAGMLAEAILQHQAAADAYRSCLVATSDTNLQTTLRMMAADHAKAVKELERRLGENSQRQKATAHIRERALPAIPNSTQATPQLPSRREILRKNIGNADFDESALFRSPAATRVPSFSSTPVQSTPGSPMDSRYVAESESVDKMSDGSYMFPQEPDPQDSVTMFLNAIEGMLDRFDQPLNLPLAFATAPLSPQAAQAVRRTPIMGNAGGRASGRAQRSRKNPVSSSETGEDDTDSDSSFCVISSASPASSSASLSDSPHKYPPTHHSSSSMTARISSSALKDENSKLQRQVQELSDRLRRAEEILRAQSEKEKAMRGSVQVLRRETQRMVASTNLGRTQLFAQMQPSLQASLLAAPSTPSAPPSQITPSRGSTIDKRRLTTESTSNSEIPTSPTPRPILDPSMDVQTLARIKDLETQVQSLKGENDHQRSQIARYRDRWQKLKENAKRRQKQIKDGPEAASGTPARIPEEDEGQKSD